MTSVQSIKISKGLSMSYTSGSASLLIYTTASDEYVELSVIHDLFVTNSDSALTATYTGTGTQSYTVYVGPSSTINVGTNGTIGSGIIFKNS